MKKFVLVLLFLVGCVEYQDPFPTDADIAKYGICGDRCNYAGCIDDFHGIECVDHGYSGICRDGKCWMPYDCTWCS